MPVHSVGGSQSPENFPELPKEGGDPTEVPKTSGVIGRLGADTRDNIPRAIKDRANEVGEEASSETLLRGLKLVEGNPAITKMRDLYLAD